MPLRKLVVGHDCDVCKGIMAEVTDEDILVQCEGCEVWVHPKCTQRLSFLPVLREGGAECMLFLCLSCATAGCYGIPFDVSKSEQPWFCAKCESLGADAAVVSRVLSVSSIKGAQKSLLHWVGVPGMSLHCLGEI